jgi:hypothetical protein
VEAKMKISLNDIAPSFLFLMDKNFEQISCNYDPESFGNALLIVRGANFSLKFTRDRSDLTVDIGDSLKGWFKLEDVLEFIDPSIQENNLEKSFDILELSFFLKKNWKEVEKIFLDPQKISQIQQFSSKKTSNFLKLIFGKY